MNNELQTARLPYLDYARVFAAYLVIYGHLVPSTNHIPRDYIYAFHMPFFFLVSGMLHKLNGTIQWRKYLRTIGIPLLFFNLVFFLIVNPIYFRYGIYGDGLVTNYLELLNMGIVRVWNGVLGKEYLPAGVTWFLVALLWCKLLMDCVHWNKKVGWSIFFFLFFITIGLHIRFMLIRNGMMAFPFYYIGCRYKKQIEQFVFRPHPLLYVALCLLIVIGLTHLNGRVSSYGVKFGSNHLPTVLCVSLFYLNAMTGSIMMLFLSTCFKENHIITYFATSLITILGMQAIFNDPYRLLFEPGHYFIIAVVAVAVLSLCVGIHWLIMKCIPFVLGK